MTAKRISSLKRTVSVATHSVQIREPNYTDRTIKFGELQHPEATVAKLVLLHFVEGFGIPVAGKGSIQVATAVPDGPNTVHGFLVLGDDPPETIHNIETKAVDFKPEKGKHIATERYYFRLCLPSHAYTGILITERKGAAGVFGRLETLLKSVMEKARGGELVWDFTPVTHPDVIARLTKAKAREVRLKFYVPPARFSEFLDERGIPSEEMSVDLVLRPRKRGGGWWGDDIEKAVRAATKAGTIVGISPDPLFKTDVLVTLGGKPRRLRFDAELAASPTFELDDIVLGEDGLPDLKSIGKAAGSLEQDLLSSIKVKGHEDG